MAPKRKRGSGSSTGKKRSRSNSVSVDVFTDLRKILANPTPVNFAKAVLKYGPKAVQMYEQRYIPKKLRSMGNYSGYAAGKFTKSAKKNPFARFTKKGFVTTVEIGTVLTGLVPGNAVYFGHASHGNTGLMIRTFSRQMVVRLFEKAGVEIVDLETETPGPGNFIVEYSYLLTDPLEININMSGLSYNQIASAITNAINTAWQSVDGQRNFVINEARVISTTNETIAKQDYRNAYIEIMVKSDLKVQNRTVATGTDEDANSTENVANQPLYGKFYTGRGNGLQCRVETNAQIGKSLIVSTATGVLSYAPAASQYWLKEPPLPILFSPLPKYHRALLDPGAVKTNTIINSYKIKLSDWFDQLKWVFQSGFKDVQQQSRMGKFAIFAMEKMICVSATDSVPVIGIELNQRCGVLITHKRKGDTAEVIEDSTYG